MKRLIYWLSTIALGFALAVVVINAMPSIIRATKPAETPQQAPEPLVDEPVAAGSDHTPGPIHYAGRPIRTTYPNEITILKRIGFEVGYDEQRGNPAWVAYRITLDKWDEEWKRPNRFTVDTDTIAKISHQDYTNSGFDRGHMAPNEAISESYGRDAQLQTFLMSNVVPQSPDLNQGPWRIFEEQLVERTKRSEELWVITGPIYDERATHIADGDVEIPDAFYKIIVDEQGDRLASIAVVMPQLTDRRDDPARFRVSIDQAEQESGWDVLPELPDEQEVMLEAVVAPGW